MSDQFSSSQEMPDIIKLFKAGKYQDIIPLLKDQLTRDPNNVQAIACLAASFSQTGMKAEAVQEFTRLTELQPENFVHYFNLGVAYETAENAAKAKECYEKVLTLNPGNQKAQQRLDAINAKTEQMTAATPVEENEPVAWTTQTALDGTIIQVPVPPVVKSQHSYSSAYEAPIPESVFQMGQELRPPDGLNWGGFLLPFWWGIWHGAWLWAVVAFFCFPISAIVLLIKGNEIAFENRKYDSIEQFKSNQRIWVICGLIINIILWGWRITRYNSTMNYLRSGASPSQITAMPSTQTSEYKTTMKEMQQALKDQQEGMGITTAEGKDENGAYISMTQTMPTDLTSTYNLFKEIVSKSGGSQIGSTSTSADFSMQTNGKLSTIHLEATNTNQTIVVTKDYK